MTADILSSPFRRLSEAVIAGGMAIVLGMASMASVAVAMEYKIGDLKIDSPWTRATPKGAQVGGGYLTITNTGATADRLIGGTLSDAGRVEIHEMKMEGTVMKMHPDPGGGLEIGPGKVVTLRPGGYHLMFMELKAPLKQGEIVKGSLTFEKAGNVPVEFSVQGLAAMTPDGGEHRMDMKRE